ncbi:MAG: thioredoxin family protein [Proteobacteria bacterium]|nr:thioredoxin family protein [Pseudomonadota bacterium]
MQINTQNQNKTGIGLGLSGPIVILLIFLLLPFAGRTAFAQDFSEFPVKGMATMIDLGAKKCIPCKLMAPILEKMEKAYRGKAHILFIDVWENRDQATRFKIKAIPTQIFFNKMGEEVYRHEGFLDETAIVEQLKKMGVPQPKFTNKG